MWISKSLNLKNTYRGHGFLALELENFIVITCYFSPNKDLKVFETQLTPMNNFIKHTNKIIILASDLNTKSGFFGSPCQDQRGTFLEDLLIANGLVPNWQCPNILKLKWFLIHRLYSNYIQIL